MNASQLNKIRVRHFLKTGKILKTHTMKCKEKAEKDDYLGKTMIIKEGAKS